MEKTTQQPVVEKMEIFDTTLMQYIVRLDDTVVADSFKRKLWKLNNEPKEPSAEGLSLMKASYYRSGYRQDNQIGRVHPKNSLACLPSLIRETMCKNYYYDLDFKCAHFQFAYHLMKKFKTPSEHTEKYILCRESCLTELAEQLNISNKEAKDLFIVAMYGGNALNIFIQGSTDPEVMLENRLSVYSEKDKMMVEKSNNNTLQGIHVEFQTLAGKIDQIFNTKQHVEGLPESFFDWGQMPIVKENRKKLKDVYKTEPKKRGFCLLSHLLQHIEWQCIEKLDKFLTDRGYSVDMLIHDGCKVRKKKDESDKLALIELLQSDTLKTFFKETIGIEFIIEDPIVIKENHQTLCHFLKAFKIQNSEKVEEFYRNHYFYRGKLYYFPRDPVVEAPIHIDPVAFNQLSYLKYLQKPPEEDPVTGKQKKSPPITIALMLRNYTKPPRSVVDNIEYRAFGDSQKFNQHDINPEQYKKYMTLNTYRPASWVYFKCAMDCTPSTLENINIGKGDSFEEHYLLFISQLKQKLAWNEGEEEEFKTTMVYKQMTQYLVDPDAPGYEYNLKYFLNWIGRCLFQPYKKSETCLTLKNSIGGTGKSGYCEHFLAPLFGEQYRLVTDPTLVLGNFNAVMHGKSLVVFDDICLADTAKAADKFKSLITSKTMQVNDKYEKIVNSNSYTSFLITTNRPCGAVLYEEHNTRRFPVIDCKEHRLSESEIEQLKVECIQKKGLLLKFLAQNYDFNFNFAKLPTSVSMDQTSFCAKNLIKRCVDYMLNGFWPSKEMISDYNSEKSNIGLQYAMNFFFTFNSILHNASGDTIGEKYVTVSDHNTRIYREINSQIVNVQASHLYTILAECANVCSAQKSEKMTSSKIKVNPDCVKFINQAITDPNSGLTEITKRGERVVLWFEYDTMKGHIHNKTIQVDNGGRVFVINVGLFKQWVENVYSPTEVKKRKETETVLYEEDTCSSETTVPTKKQRCSQSVQDEGKHLFSFVGISIS